MKQLCFSNEFEKYVGELKNSAIYRKIKSFLERISQGLLDEEESDRDNLLKQSKIDDDLTLIWSVDILKEGSHHVQVLKIWDVVPSCNALEAVKRLDLNHMKYTSDEIEKCRARCITG